LSFIYNENNKLIEQHVGNSYIIKYQYDDDLKTKTEQRYNSNGIIEYETVTKYFDDNLIAEEKNLRTTTRYFYEFWD
jgi:hypothetical protein